MWESKNVLPSYWVTSGLQVDENFGRTYLTNLMGIPLQLYAVCVLERWGLIKGCRKKQWCCNDTWYKNCSNISIYDFFSRKFERVLLESESCFTWCFSDSSISYYNIPLSPYWIYTKFLLRNYVVDEVSATFFC